jgi:hypothetical protein
MQAQTVLKIGAEKLGWKPGFCAAFLKHDDFRCVHCGAMLTIQEVIRFKKFCRGCSYMANI